MSEEKIRDIAQHLYVERKNNCLPGDHQSDWLKAKSIYDNKLKHSLWFIWRLISKHHYEIVAIIAIFSVFLNIYTFKKSMKLNETSAILNFRPYVTIDMENPIKFSNEKDVFYGNNIVLKNKGKIPASMVSTEYYVTTDIDQDNMFGLEWFNKNLGGRGAISFIAPDEIKTEAGFRSLSPTAGYYYFEAITSYEGHEQNKKYWMRTKKVYFVDKNSNNLYPVYVYGEWDRNTKIIPPNLSTKKEVIELFQSFKGKKDNKS